MARQLFLTIGTIYYKPPIDTLKASSAVKRILNSHNILADNLTQLYKTALDYLELSRVSTKT